ncbi:MAG: hypothetical protein ABIF11_09270 [Nitrospirota bacterium]
MVSYTNVAFKDILIPNGKGTSSCHWNSGMMEYWGFNYPLFQYSIIPFLIATWYYTLVFSGERKDFTTKTQKLTFSNF